MKSLKPRDIDAYISSFPVEIRHRLGQIRATILKTAPQAVEVISYGIPTFNLNGTYLIYFAAYKRHIGIYPVPGDLETIDKAFTNYQTSGKGTIQFPHDKPIPMKLVVKLVKHRINQTQLKRSSRS